jgi:hypothetical protein
VTALLLSPFGRIGLYVVAALAVVAGVAFWLHEHDARIRAEDAARVAAVTAAAELANVRAGAAALASSLADAEARASRVVTIKTEIARAPITQGCASSPSVRVALDAMRGAAGSGSGAASGSGGAATVPAAAGATKSAPR